MEKPLFCKHQLHLYCQQIFIDDIWVSWESFFTHFFFLFSLGVWVLFFFFVFFRGFGDFLDFILLTRTQYLWLKTSTQPCYSLLQKFELTSDFLLTYMASYFSSSPSGFLIVLREFYISCSSDCMLDSSFQTLVFCKAILSHAFKLDKYLPLKLRVGWPLSSRLFQWDYF